MKLTPVDSTNVAAHGYDEATKTLMIQFKNSKNVYHYPNVEAHVYHSLKNAKSVGGYVHEHIKGKPFTIK